MGNDKILSWMVTIVVTRENTEILEVNILKHGCLQINLVLVCTINPSQLSAVLGIHWAVVAKGRGEVLGEGENQVEGCK